MSHKPHISAGLLAFGAFLLSFFSLPVHEAQAFDEFDTEHAPPRFTLDYKALTLEIKGRARVGLHDLQGDGGPKYDSPTDTATIGTRSPFVELDSFELAFRLNWKEFLWLNANVAFLTDSTSLSAIYFEYKQQLETWFSHGAELGYQNSLAATHRHTVRYPLIATNYWKNPEYHAAYGAKFEFTENTTLSLYGSVAFMRPLKSEPIHGSPTYAGSYKTLSYGSAKPFSGNSASGTLLLRLQTYGVTAEAFGNIGQITTKKGIDTLVSDYPYYRSLDGFDSAETEALAWWAGGRLAYNGYGVHVMGECIASQEQLIKRIGMYAQASYTWQRDAEYLNTFEILARYEQTWLQDATRLNTSGTTLRTPDVNNAISWDHQVITLAGRLNLIEDILSIRLEYSFFLENNAVPSKDIQNQSVDDNELLLQIEARY
ncbi:MAG: hypothetical protein IJ165_03210 [Proteobacteria bacterium]|nr:hypothetical protein [Pseudomonadota bacterium]